MYFASERWLSKDFSVSVISSFAIFSICVVQRVPLFTVMVSPLNIVGVEEKGVCGYYLKLLLAFSSSCRKLLVPEPSESSTCTMTMSCRTPLVRYIKIHKSALVCFMFRT